MIAIETYLKATGIFQGLSIDQIQELKDSIESELSDNSGRIPYAQRKGHFEGVIYDLYIQYLYPEPYKVTTVAICLASNNFEKLTHPIKVVTFQGDSLITNRLFAPVGVVNALKLFKKLISAHDK